MQRCRIIIISGFLSLFLAYLAGVTLFTHVHQINGVYITHSHPFSDGDHTHTSAEFLLVDRHNQVLLLQADPVEVTGELFVEVTVTRYNFLPLFTKTVVRQASLRAPPSCS